MSWRWIDKTALLHLHDISLVEHGGARGMREAGLLDSALARPVHLAAYENPDCAALAACYGVGLAKNHAFVDGNKRAAFLAIGLFLYLNGHRLTASQVDATLVMLAVADGSMNEAQLADWLRQHIGPQN